MTASCKHDWAINNHWDGGTAPYPIIQCIRCNEISAEAAPLDVERLAEAMAGTGYEAHSSDTVQWAGEVAAEYARLTEGTDR